MTRCEDAPCCGHVECGFGPGAIGWGFYPAVPLDRPDSDPDLEDD